MTYRLDLRLDSERVIRRNYDKLALTTFLMTFVQTNTDLNKVVHGLNQLFNEGVAEFEFSLTTGNILVYEPAT